MRVSLNQSVRVLGSVGLAIASLGITVTAKADTVNARCDVYPKGSDSVTSTGPCTFSQRQGFVGIQLQNGTRYDLTPINDKPGKYKDQNNQRGHREDSLGDLGVVFRLANESIFVYWETAQEDPEKLDACKNAVSLKYGLQYNQVQVNTINNVLNWTLPNGRTGSCIINPDGSVSFGQG